LNFEIFIPVFIVFPALLYFFSKRYKWNNWSDKLIGSKTLDKTF
jgi:hypothetical protein